MEGFARSKDSWRSIILRGVGRIEWGASVSLE